MLKLVVLYLLLQCYNQYQNQNQLLLENAVDSTIQEQKQKSSLIQDKNDANEEKAVFINSVKFLDHEYIQEEHEFTQIQDKSSIFMNLGKNEILNYFTNNQQQILLIFIILFVSCLLSYFYLRICFQKKDQPNVENSLTLINHLYEQSWKKRKIEPEYLSFLREQENEQNFKKEYFTNNEDIEECNAFIPVRGDGNCFYTAFCYQFLQIVLTKYDNNEYNQFIAKVKQQLKFVINFEGSQFNEEQGRILSNDFFQRLQNLRNSRDKNILFSYYKNYEYINKEYDGAFYGLATIFIRNLAEYAVSQNELFKDILEDRNNLLIWEVECNSNEIVIQSLAQYLQLSILLLIFKDKQLIRQVYCPENKNQIILLLKPGHYNIGLKV